MQREIAATTSPSPGPFAFNEPVPITGYSIFSLTAIWSKESPLAVEGPYFGDGYYAFSAVPGRKFLILALKLRNVGNSPAETPTILAGTVYTDKGHQFPNWGPPLGIHSEEYSPRPASPEETESLAGGNAWSRNLFPGEESETGILNFELPADETAVSMSLANVDRRLALR